MSTSILTSRMKRPDTGSRAYFSPNAQGAVCELLYVRSCAVRGLCRTFALRMLRALTAHAMSLMTYPHSPLCTITHYRYSDSLYSHSITTTTSHSTPALPTLIPHSLFLTCPPLASCIVHAIGTGIVCLYCLLARRVTGVELTQAIQNSS